MPIPDEIYKQMSCCLNQNSSHIVCEPVLIANCNGHACKNCINSIITETAMCFHCNGTHKKEDLLKMQINPTLKELVEKTYFNDLIGIFNDKLKNILNTCAGFIFLLLFEIKISFYIYINLEELLRQEVETRFELIENEIDIKVECLINELHKKRQELRDEIIEYKNQFLRFKLNN